MGIRILFLNANSTSHELAQRKSKNGTERDEILVPKLSCNFLFVRKILMKCPY